MEQNLEINIADNNFKSSESFGQAYACPLFRRLKEMFPTASVYVLEKLVSIIDDQGIKTFYEIPYNEIWGGKDAKYSARTINDMIAKARSNQPIEEVKFSLKVIFKENLSQLMRAS